MQALSEQDRASYIDRYDGEIRFMDRHLGRLLSALERLGRYDDALIVVTSDHGELFGEHRLMQHGHALYDELIRVPLIVHFPGGRERGRFRDDTVSTVDLLRIVGDELGIPLPAEVESIPLGQREVAHAACSRGAWFVERYGAAFDRDLLAAVRWPWKVILSDGGSFEAYRLDADRREQIDRRDEPEARRLRASLEAERAARPPRGPRERAPLPDPELRERLRALGYLP